VRRCGQPRVTAAPESSRGRSIVLGGMLLALGAGPGRTAAQISAQPVILELRTTDSAAVTSFAVRNESLDEMQVRVYAADFDQAEDGGHTFLEAGTHPRTCADRLQFFPDDIVLPGHGAAEVRVRLEPGDSTCWSLVFVQSQARDPGGIRIAQRIGVKVYGVARRAVPAGEIRSVAVAGSGESGRRVEITFHNTGDGPVRPEGELEIRTSEGDIAAVVPVEPFSVLPGRTRATSVPLAPLDPGSYLLIPILDFGADYLAGGQARLEVEE
jgi:hypothetical protein